MQYFPNSLNFLIVMFSSSSLSNDYTSGTSSSATSSVWVDCSLLSITISPMLGEFLALEAANKQKHQEADQAKKTTQPQQHKTKQQSKGKQ